MKRVLIGLLGMALFTVGSLSFANGKCRGIRIVSVGHRLCAQVKSLNIQIPAGPGSQLNRMHKGFGRAIYGKFRNDVRAGRIPHMVEGLIKYIHFNKHTYVCGKVYVAENMLHMDACKMQRR